MDEAHSAVQRYGLNAYTHELRTLQLLEHPVKHTALAPAVHVRVEGMPLAKAGRQAAPSVQRSGEARRDVFDYIELFYNSTRRHNYSNGRSPIDYEKQYEKRLASV